MCRDQLGDALGKLRATGEAFECMESANESLRQMVREKDGLLSSSEATIDELRYSAKNPWPMPCQHACVQIS